MDEFNFKDLSQNDILYAIGSIIAGICYGFNKFFSNKKPETNVQVQDVEAELIKILRQHVEDENEKNKSQQCEIKQLKENIDILESENSRLKRIIRNFDEP